jgi:hypothetical protein
MIEKIIKIVCDDFGVTKEQIITRNRYRELCVPRQVIMYFVRKYTQLTYIEIGKLVERNHVTAVYANKTIQTFCETDKKFNRRIRIIENRLNREANCELICLLGSYIDLSKIGEICPVSVAEFRNNVFTSAFDFFFSKGVIVLLSYDIKKKTWGFSLNIETKSEQLSLIFTGIESREIAINDMVFKGFEECEKMR